MFTDFVLDAINRLAGYELIDDGKTYYGSIKGFRGVWAEGKTLSECEKNLREVLEEWLLLKIRKKQVLPTTRKYDLNELLS
jgi:predicted RNase H-like HicB family nuclease